METLQGQVRQLGGRVCLMCVGNRDGGDDAVGVLLGERLARGGLPDVVIAGTEPERQLARCRECGCDHLIFIDAVDFGADPGSVMFLSARDMTTRFPQVSTHRLSIGLLGQLAESSGTTRAWLLGVQPRSLQPGSALSPNVQMTMDALAEFLMRWLKVEANPC